MTWTQSHLNFSLFVTLENYLRGVSLIWGGLGRSHTRNKSRGAGYQVTTLSDARFPDKTGTFPCVTLLAHLTLKVPAFEGSYSRINGLECYWVFTTCDVTMGSINSVVKIHDWRIMKQSWYLEAARVELFSIIEQIWIKFFRECSSYQYSKSILVFNIYNTSYCNGINDSSNT